MGCLPVSKSPFAVELPATTVMVNISIKVSDLPHYAVVPILDEQGLTQPQPDVVLTIPYGGEGRGTVTARIKGKAFRRLMNEIRLYANPADKLVLTGRLTAAGEIEAAGFKPFVKDSSIGDRNLVA